MVSIFQYGPEHEWFAWYPVETALHGWKWLRKVKRRKCWVRVDKYALPGNYWWVYSL